MSFGQGGASWAMSRYSPEQQIYPRNFSDLMSLSGGDLHRDTSGRPLYFARISVDSSDNTRLLLWPYPDDDYLIDVWYSVMYTENTTFATNLFSGDAPEIAYDAVQHRVNWRAYRYDKQYRDAQDEWQLYMHSIGLLNKRENDYHRDASMKVATYRRGYHGQYPVRSLYAFDRKGAQR